MACRVAIAPALASVPPSSPFFGVSAVGPYPQPGPWGMADLWEDVLGCPVSGGVRPSSSARMQRPEARDCRGLLLGVQIGTDGPHLCEDCCRGWDGPPCPPFPAFPDGHPQAVQPCRDRHHPGLGFTARPASFLKTRLDAWSSLGFQDVPGGPFAHRQRRSESPRCLWGCLCARLGLGGVRLRRPRRTALPSHPVPPGLVVGRALRLGACPCL